MPEATVSLLTTWQPFYGIIGTAAATLTGLMFVVVTFIARAGAPRTNEVFAAFSSPNIPHFGAALFIAAMQSAPWQVLWAPALLLGLCGLAGVIYVVIVGRRMRRQKSYQPVLEDWLWHLAFPLVSYAALVVAALVLPGHPEPALFVSGGATVLLLFIGIHNAWDAVVYLTLQRSRSENTPPDE